MHGHESTVYKLKKALYSLKQAPEAWYNRVDNHFLKLGFERCMNEHTFHKKILEDGNTQLVCIYVDDIICMGSSQVLINEFITDMKDTFEMSDLSLLKYFLGLEVQQGEEGIFISQKKYIQDLLKLYNMQECKIVVAPINSNERLQANDGSGETDDKRYRALVGKLIYLTHTHPDISFTVGVLLRFMSRPTKHHLGAGKRVFWYLAGKVQFGLWYSHTKECKLEVYTDSD